MTQLCSSHSYHQSCFQAAVSAETLWQTHCTHPAQHHQTDRHTQSHENQKTNINFSLTIHQKNQVSCREVTHFQSHYWVESRCLLHPDQRMDSKYCRLVIIFINSIQVKSIKGCQDNKRQISSQVIMILNIKAFYGLDFYGRTITTKAFLSFLSSPQSSTIYE